jgi:hypothetical protein
MTPRMKATWTGCVWDLEYEGTWYGYIAKRQGGRVACYPYHGVEWSIGEARAVAALMLRVMRRPSIKGTSTRVLEPGP